MTRTYIESLFSNCPLLDKFNVEINITCDDEVKHVWTPREDRRPLPRQGWCGEEQRLGHSNLDALICTLNRTPPNPLHPGTCHAQLIIP